MLVVFILLGLIATAVGGLVPMAQSLLSRQNLLRLFAFRSGVLVAVAILDLLPEAWKYQPALASAGALSAFLVFYVIQNFAMVDTCAEYIEDCPHHLLGWAALAGLFVHSFMDGFNLGASFEAGAGLAVGAVMVLHKTMDGFTLTSLFRQTGYSSAQSLLGLGVMAAATPLGCWVSVLGMSALPPSWTAALLGAAGGSFLYLSTAALSPNLHKKSDPPSFASFAAGALLLWVLHGLNH